MKSDNRSSSSGGERSTLRFYPFDLKVQRIPFHPEKGHLLLTIYGALVRVVSTGELRLICRAIIRNRDETGKLMSLMDFGCAYLPASNFETQNIACLVDYIREHPADYAGLIQEVESEPPMSVGRLSLDHPDVPRTATGVPRELQTPLDFPVPDSIKSV